MPDAYPYSPADPHARRSRTTTRRSSRYDDPFGEDALREALSGGGPPRNPDDPAPHAPGHPLNTAAPDYRDPLANEPPLNGDMRAQWLEERGYDPKAEADLKRANAGGIVINGEFVCDPEPGELDLIRDGIEHDECPDLPDIPREFNMKPRWESFCRLYAFGHSAADAARHAGYAWGTSKHAGWRLLQDPRIRRRIAALQQYAHDYRP